MAEIPVSFVGAQVRMHPASDWFMRGITSARIVGIGRKWVHFEATTPGLVNAKFKIGRSSVNAHVESVQS